MEKVRYMISDAASIVNVESHVLRYWEDELELDIPRNEMGHRYYTKENIQEFQRIKELKEQGYQLKAIRMIVHSDALDGLPQDPAGEPAKLAGGENVVGAAKAAGARPGSAPKASAGRRADDDGQAVAAGQADAAAQPAAGGQINVAAQAMAQPATGGQTNATVQPAAGASPGSFGQELQAAGRQPGAAEAAAVTPQERKDSGEQAGRMLGRQAAGLKQPGDGKITPLKEPGNPIYLTTIRESGGQVTTGEVYAAGKQLLAQESRQSILDNTDKMAQFTDLMTQIVGKALAANNQELSQSISDDVGKQVIKEMNYLMREREELDEDRFRRLDAAIRGNLKKRDEDRRFFKKKKK